MADIEKKAQLKANNGKRSKSRILRGVVLVLAVLLLCVIVALAVVVLLLYQQVAHKTDEVCLTKECVMVAARVSSNLDYSVDPCTNFYDFACGTWMKKHVVPADRSNLYTYGVLRDDVRVTLKYLLERDGYDDVEAVRKARSFYKACMNESHIESLDTKLLTDLLTDLGGYPTLGNQTGGGWDPASFSLLEDLVALRRLAVSTFISVKVGPDVKNSTQKLIHIVEPPLDFRNKDMYEDEDYSAVRTAFLQYRAAVIGLLGATSDVAEIDVQQGFELETKLANLTLSNSEKRNRDAQYNKITIRQLEMNYTIPELEYIKFNWTEYLQRVISPWNENVTLTLDDEVIMEAPRYYGGLFDVLAHVSPRTVKNYLLTKVVDLFVSFLPQRFLEEREKFKTIQFGTNSKDPRWKKCCVETIHIFGMAVGRLFVKDTFDEEAKEKALELIHDIRDAFLQRLTELDWMDEDTRERAADKVRHIKEKIGYPNFILDDEELNEYYKSIQLEENDYMQGYLNYIEHRGRVSLTGLRDPFEKNASNSEIYPTSVNAQYILNTNMVSFPAGILQPPYYSKYQPGSMNYGSIGWLIGHEITHAFDDIGRRYDKEGHLRQWWSNDAIAKFEERTKCIIDQYNQYILPQSGAKIDGDHTQGENIADNGGLVQSFKAYQLWMSRHGAEEQLLPGLNYTHDQLFFINFAQGWCGVSTNQYEIDQVHTDAHSPGRFRVIGSLQNSEDFARTFGCRQGTYMNPSKKCHVW